MVSICVLLYKSRTIIPFSTVQEVSRSGVDLFPSQEQRGADNSLNGVV
jgi:hypothetical protein